MTNQKQIDYWNAEAGATWVRQANTFDRMFAHLGEEMLARAKLVSGEQVLDIGCGSGATSFLAQDQVGAEGQVTGVDVSLPLINLSSKRAEDLGSPAQFIEADAATWSGGSLFDVIISRIGVMFFDNPQKAFTNLRNLTKPGGRLSFACWRRADESEFFTLPMRVLAPLLDEPMTMPDPALPGPYAFGDKNRINAILSAAGWDNISISPWEGTVQVPGTTPTQCAAFIAGMGGLARLINAKKIDKDRLIEALADALKDRMENGEIWLSSPAWFVTARR